MNWTGKALVMALALCGAASAGHAQDARQAYYSEMAIRAAAGGQDACELVGNDAANMVLKRYAGARLSEQLREDANPYRQAMLTRAYALDRMLSDMRRDEQAAAFRDAAEVECVNAIGAGTAGMSDSALLESMNARLDQLEREGKLK